MALGRIDVEVDGSRIGDSENGIWRSHDDDRFVSFTHLVQDLSAGSHTFKLQSRQRPNSNTLRRRRTILGAGDIGTPGVRN